MRRRAQARAASVLARDVEAFAAAGYPESARRSGLRTILGPGGRRVLRLELVPGGGRIFGGAFAMEVSTKEPVLPATRGIHARGHGTVRTERLSFRASRGDAAGQAVAQRLETDAGLQRALREVHFEQIRVEPDGRAVIRHMGGSLVWLLFPPMARPIAISDEQVRRTIAGLRAFEQAGKAIGV